MTTLFLLAAITPDADASRGHAGHFIVDNDRFITVYAYVDGRRLGTVEPEETQAFAVPTGYHRLEVRCAKGSSLFRDEELVRPREVVRAEIDAWEGKLIVENETPFGGTLYIDGQDKGWLASGDERVLVLAPGTVDVTLRGQGMVLDSETARIRTGQRTFVDAEEPAFAELDLVNPLPVAVEVRVEGSGTIRLPPGARRTLHGVEVDEVDVEIRLASTGRLIERCDVKVSPYTGGELRVPVPKEAPLALHNTGSRTLKVFIDGRFVATLSAYADRVVEVDVGWARLEIRDDRGRTLEEQRIEIDPYDNRDLRVGARSSSARAEYRRSSSSGSSSSCSF